MLVVPASVPEWLHISRIHTSVHTCTDMLILPVHIHTYTHTYISFHSTWAIGFCAVALFAVIRGAATSSSASSPEDVLPMCIWMYECMSACTVYLRSYGVQRPPPRPLWAHELAAMFPIAKLLAVVSTSKLVQETDERTWATVNYFASGSARSRSLFWLLSWGVFVRMHASSEYVCTESLHALHEWVYVCWHAYWMRVCVCLHAYLNESICVFTCIPEWEYFCIHACLNGNMHAYTHTRMSTSTQGNYSHHAYMNHASVNEEVCMNMYARMSEHVCTHAYTWIRLRLGVVVMFLYGLRWTKFYRLIERLILNRPRLAEEQTTCLALTSCANLDVVFATLKARKKKRGSVCGLFHLGFSWRAIVSWWEFFAKFKVFILARLASARSVVPIIVVRSLLCCGEDNVQVLMIWSFGWERDWVVACKSLERRSEGSIPLLSRELILRPISLSPHCNFQFLGRHTSCVDGMERNKSTILSLDSCTWFLSFKAGEWLCWQCIASRTSHTHTHTQCTDSRSVAGMIGRTQQQQERKVARK